MRRLGWAFRASPRPRAVARTTFGLALMLAVAAHVGAAPFVRGILAVSPATVVAALVLAAVATAAASWRWRVIACRLGLTLAPTAAMTSATACPADRSNATARDAWASSPTPLPWAIARSTSPITPPGSAVLRNCDR